MRRRLCSATAIGVLAIGAPLIAETYRFIPATYHTTLSSAHPVAQRLKSGDRLVTATAGDPAALIGPFFVEEAAPGDLLVVTIDRLAPRGAAGTSTSTMAGAVIVAGSLSSRPDSTAYPWLIDEAAGVARLDLHAVSKSTDWKGRFADPALVVPLRPALGAIAVAPPGPEPAGPLPGAHGGTLLAGAVGAGARVMLPVFHPGALLFLGHGLAAQGDGAVTGTGIESALEVEFTVEVVKKQSWPHSSVVRPSTVVGEFEMAWPRIETDRHLMTVGSSAASLQDALRHATLELHHWLDDDFGLSEKAVSLLMGQAVEYQIARVSDAAFTVVARVSKASLPAPVR
ncbi:MAG: acetamidase/formamidase family protein [Vicinamibacterales bacterium]